MSWLQSKPGPSGTWVLLANQQISQYTTTYRPVGWFQTDAGRPMLPSALVEQYHYESEDGPRAVWVSRTDVPSPYYDPESGTRFDLRCYAFGAEDTGYRCAWEGQSGQEGGLVPVSGEAYVWPEVYARLMPPQVYAMNRDWFYGSYYAPLVGRVPGLREPDDFLAEMYVCTHNWPLPCDPELSYMSQLCAEGGAGNMGWDFVVLVSLYMNQPALVAYRGGRRYSWQQDPFVAQLATNACQFTYAYSEAARRVNSRKIGFAELVGAALTVWGGGFAFGTLLAAAAGGAALSFSQAISAIQSAARFTGINIQGLGFLKLLDPANYGDALASAFSGTVLSAADWETAALSAANAAGLAQADALAAAIADGSVSVADAQVSIMEAAQAAAGEVASAAPIAVSLNNVASSVTGVTSDTITQASAAAAATTGASTMPLGQDFDFGTEYQGDFGYSDWGGMDTGNLGLDVPAIEGDPLSGTELTASVGDFPPEGYVMDPASGEYLPMMTDAAGNPVMAMQAGEFQSAGGETMITDAQGTAYYFDADGNLIGIEDINGNALPLPGADAAEAAAAAVDSSASIATQAAQAAGASGFSIDSILKLLQGGLSIYSAVQKLTMDKALAERGIRPGTAGAGQTRTVRDPRTGQLVTQRLDTRTGQWVTTGLAPAGAQAGGGLSQPIGGVPLWAWLAGGGIALVALSGKRR
ncbi:MAG: hypothetical protein ACREPG_00190 [Candidatus Binatia bacterium]